MSASDQPKHSFWRFFRITFLRGLAALLPAIVTVWLLVKVVQLLNTYAAVPITRLPILILKAFNADPVLVEQMTAFANSWAVRLLAFLVTVVLVCLLGAVLVRAVGRKLWSLLVENAFGKLPIIKAIYPRIKQLSDFLFTEKRQLRDFRSVVAIEYPRKGVFSIGFITGDGLTDVDAGTGRHHVTVFIPSSPTPLTGYTILVPPEDLIPLNLTPEQVLPMLVSGGVISPEHAPAPPRAAQPPN